MLETFPNKHPENDYFVKFNCPEFTSLCPMTGQPDFATIYISYVPVERMVESKSLKLYLWSYRNEGAFHEDVTNRILDDLVEATSPRRMKLVRRCGRQSCLCMAVAGFMAIKPLPATIVWWSPGS